MRRDWLNEDRPVPRALVGWPEGSVYTPREPVFFTDLYPADVPPSIRRYRGRAQRRQEGPG